MNRAILVWLLAVVSCVAPRPSTDAGVEGGSKQDAACSVVEGGSVTTIAKVLAWGDSITAAHPYTTPVDSGGQGMAKTVAYPSRACTILGLAEPVNHGLVGYRLDELTHYWTLVGAADLSLTTSNVVTCLAGINNITTDNETTQNMIDFLRSWAVTVRASLDANTVLTGHQNYLVWGTLTAFEGGSAPMNAVWRAFVDWVGANWRNLVGSPSDPYYNIAYAGTGARFDEIFDNATDPHMGVMPFAPANPGNVYIPDGLHPSVPLGQDLVSFNLARALQRLGIGGSMATNFLEYLVARNAKMNAIVTLLNGGKLKVYTGAQPTTEGAITGTLLATLALNATSGVVSGGVLTFNAIASASAVADGTAGYAVLEETDSSTVVATGSIGTSGTDFIIDDVAILTGRTVSVTAGTWTAPP